MICIALGMQRVETNGTLHYVFVFVDVVGAPWTEIAVHERTWPIVTVRLVVSRVKIQVAVCTMFSDNFWTGAIALRALHWVL